MSTQAKFNSHLQDTGLPLYLLSYQVLKVQVQILLKSNFQLTLAVSDYHEIFLSEQPQQVES